MILADTTVWIDHFRSRDPVLQYELNLRNIVTHPYVVAELALGSLRDRSLTVAALDNMPQLRLALMPEVRVMIEAHALHGQGIGLVDAHLLASTLMTPLAQLWTRDKRLRRIAEELGVAAGLTWASDQRPPLDPQIRME